MPEHAYLFQIVDCLPTKRHFGHKVTGWRRRNVILDLTYIVVYTNKLRHGACHRQSAAFHKKEEIPLEQIHRISSLGHSLTTTGVVVQMAAQHSKSLLGGPAMCARVSLTPPTIKLDYSFCRYQGVMLSSKTSC